MIWVAPLFSPKIYHTRYIYKQFAVPFVFLKKTYFIYILVKIFLNKIQKMHPMKLNSYEECWILFKQSMNRDILQNPMLCQETCTPKPLRQRKCIGEIRAKKKLSGRLQGVTND